MNPAGVSTPVARSRHPYSLASCSTRWQWSASRHRCDPRGGVAQGGRYPDERSMTEGSGARVQLGELLEDVEVRSFHGDPRVEIRPLTHDSRRVGAGACFACVPGPITDGHAHAPEPIAAGAVALL